MAIFLQAWTYYCVLRSSESDEAYRRRTCGMIHQAWLMRGPPLCAHPSFRYTSKRVHDFRLGLGSGVVSSMSQSI